jgi:hypothetical protein
MDRYPFVWLALAASLASSPVAAQQANLPIVIASSVCNAIAHVSDAPGVDYAAGVDVDGKPVAAADLPSGNTALNRSLASAPTKITVDLQKRFHIPANANLFQGKSQIGYVTIQDGKAYLDGQPLNTAEEGLLAAACQEQRR